MLGRRDPQERLFSASTLLEDQLDELGVYGRLARDGWRIFKDEDFARMYSSDTGRPSVPPSMLALATLLQFHDGVSDAEVIERCRFDLRWKAALHLHAHDTTAPFAKSTFQAYRSRLILHEEEGRIFETSLRVAREAGLLPGRFRLILDSSPVRGRGALKDTYNLLSDAITKVLRRVAAEQERAVEEVASEAGLSRHVEAPSIKGSVEIDWSDESQRRAFLASLLEDCDTALGLARTSECEGEESQLLEQVIRQDVEREVPEEDGEGGPRIRRGVAKDRVTSVSDPEMRHGRKSSGKTYDGHKAHVGTTEGGVVTYVDVDAPSEPEGAKVAEAVEATREVTGSEVDEVLGDTAYGSRRAIGQAEAAGVVIRSKMPSSPKGRLGPEEFEVSEDRLEARCPAGHASERRHRSRDDFVHKWSASVCGACPLRARCTEATARSLRVAPNFHDRRARERYADSSEGRAVLRKRVVVEHVIGRLKRLGAGRARYFGRRKTRLQWLMTSAVANLSLIWNARPVGEVA